MLVESGMDISSALLAIERDVKSKWMKRIVSKIHERVESGDSIWRAIEFARFLPPYVISLIKIGEGSGRLSDNLKAVVVQQQKERTFKAKVQSAMLYPVFVLGLTTIVGVGIAWFILPRLATVFTSLKMELPWITKVLIAVGGFFGGIWHLLCATVCACDASDHLPDLLWAKDKGRGSVDIVPLSGCEQSRAGGRDLAIWLCARNVARSGVAYS